MISSRPTNTPTEASTGASIIGRIRMRSISRPMTNETTTVMTKATQYGSPALIRVSAM